MPSHSALTGLHLWRRYPWQTEERLAAEAALRAMGVVPASAGGVEEVSDRKAPSPANLLPEASPSDSNLQQPSK